MCYIIKVGVYVQSILLVMLTYTRWFNFVKLYEIKITTSLMKGGQLHTLDIRCRWHKHIARNKFALNKTDE